MTNKTPTQTPNDVIEVTDSVGRKICLKRPPILNHSRFVVAMGEGMQGVNTLALGMYACLEYVNSIDGVPVPTPSSKLEIEALLSRLDYHGLEVVNNGVSEHFLKQKKDTEIELKNS
jgi:hypothetical protein